MRIVLLGLVLAVLGLLGGYIWFQKFLRSDRFREIVNLRVSEKLEAEASFDKFVWDGTELHAPHFSVRGEKMIRRVDMEGFETEIKFGPLLSKRVETQEIRARRLHVDVDVRKDGPQFGGGGRRVFTFTAARIDELSGMVDWGTTAMKWEGIKASVTPGHSRGSYDATLTRGRLLTPLSLFPKLDLQEASLRYADRALFVKSGTWHVFESGRLATDGEIDFGRGRYFFNGNLTNVQCEEVLPDDWKKRLRGELSSEFTVEGAGKNPPVVTGKLELVGGHLTALPVLDRIAAYTLTERFRRIGMRQASLAYRQEGERLELTRIVIASEGLLRIEGKLTIEAGQLEGQIRLGLTPTTLARLPGAKNRVFFPGKNGMLWAPVRITGTTAFPREDLSERLVAAGVEWMYEMVDSELVLKHSGRAAGEFAQGLWKTAETAAEIGVGIIGQGAEILKNGVLPNPIDPIREGVGSVLDGLLGPPRRRPEVEPRSKPKTTPKDLFEDEDKKALEKENEPEKKAGEKPRDGANKKGEEPESKTLPEKAQDLLGEELGVKGR